MEQDKILKILNTVEVEVLSEKEYEGSYLCKIEDIEKGHLYISLPIEKGHFIPLRSGTLVRINVTQTDGVYSFSEHILRRVMSPYPHFVIKYPQKIQRIQRRNYVRLMLNIPIEFKLEEEENKYKGVSIDLSGGGVFLVTQKQLEIGQKLIINFKLTNGLECCNIKSVVKRERVIEDQNGAAVKRNYGIEFVEINQKLREEIISYLFELQRERRKNNKDF